MILSGVVLAVLIGWLRGGKIARLADLKLRGLIWVAAAALVRLGLDLLSRHGYSLPWLMIVAYCLVFYVLFLNIRLPGIKLFTAGTLLNFLVIAANGGTMPVSATAIKEAGLSSTPAGTHILLSETARLPFLADIIPLRPPYFPFPQVISVGDILLVCGIFLFIQYKMLREEEPAAAVAGKK
ncbi:MAG: DUF5317 domain-containing protein [Firmicutes bacterium]|nr:DUF5317 domain-containing protein [Bacillota bacterium]